MTEHGPTWRARETCARKRKFATEGAAGSALGRMQKSFKKHGWVEPFLHIYRCSVCSQWHIGHDSKARREREELAKANIRRQSATSPRGDTP